jgi:hypothetical protein
VDASGIGVRPSTSRRAPIITRGYLDMLNQFRQAAGQPDLRIGSEEVQRVGCVYLPLVRSRLHVGPVRQLTAAAVLAITGIDIWV